MIRVLNGIATLANVVAIGYFLWKALMHFKGVDGILRGLGNTFGIIAEDQYGGYGVLLLLFAGFVAILALVLVSAYKNADTQVSGNPDYVALFIRLIVAPALIVLIANFALS